MSETHYAVGPGGEVWECHVHTSEEMEQRYFRLLRGALFRHQIRLTAEELQERLRSFDEPVAICEDATFRTRDGRKFLDRYLDRIKDLWNYTSREQLDGQRPVDAFEALLESGGSDEELAACPIHVPSDFRPHPVFLEARWREYFGEKFPGRFQS